MDTKELIKEIESLHEDKIMNHEEDNYDSGYVHAIDDVLDLIKKPKLTQPHQTINLSELEDKLDKALECETPESIKKWLNKQRQQQKEYADMDSETSDVLWHELRIYCKEHYGIPWDKMWMDVGGAVLWRCLSGFILNHKNRIKDLEGRINHLRSQLSNAIAERDKPQANNQTNETTAIKLLSDLADMQNGAPLVQHEKEYNELIQKVYKFLESNEPQTHEGELIELLSIIIMHDKDKSNVTSLSVLTRAMIENKLTQFKALQNTNKDE